MWLTITALCAGAVLWCVYRLVCEVRHLRRQLTYAEDNASYWRRLSD